jgi:hypothetical protein
MEFGNLAIEEKKNINQFLIFPLPFSTLFLLRASISALATTQSPESQLE